MTSSAETRSARPSFALDERVYANAGNPPLIDLLGEGGRVLDVGCGAGDNAVLIKKRNPTATVLGITVSNAEANVARAKLDACWVVDIETDLPFELAHTTIDTLVFSHVLEHVRCPAQVLARFVKIMPPGGRFLSLSQTS